MSEEFFQCEPSRPTIGSQDQKNGTAVYAPGTEFDGWRLEEKIGRGGLGEVWKARDLDGERDVAIKFVPRDIQNFDSEMERVRKTFQTIHALQHSNICPVYGMHQHDDFGAYLVMKFLKGVSLEFLLRRKQKLPLEWVTKILEPVAKALDYAHQQEVVHRDVKPANIMLDFARNSDGSLNFEELKDVQLIDFGLAAEFRRSMSRVSQIRMPTSGTRSYMSPEQFRGRLQNAFSDQYSLAVVAYELLAGHLPFETDDDQTLRECVLNEAPEWVPGLESAVNEALLKGMAKERESRFPTCEEFVQALANKQAPINQPSNDGGSPPVGTPAGQSGSVNGWPTGTPAGQSGPVNGWPTGTPAGQSGPVSGWPIGTPAGQSGPVSGWPIGMPAGQSGPVNGWPIGTTSGQRGPVNGRPVGAPPVSGNPVGAPPVSGNPVGVPPVSGNPVGVPPVSGNPVGVPPVNGNPVGAPPVSGRPLGNGPQGQGWEKRNPKQKNILWDAVEEIFEDPRGQKVGQKLGDLVRHVFWNMKRD
ncbi:MAG: hypothetical protein E7029_09565 [Planctomycetaceae bacterium]|nr:hypothetical protein [Planctomycetaceae bacterium]